MWNDIPADELKQLMDELVWWTNQSSRQTFRGEVCATKMAMADVDVRNPGLSREHPDPKYAEFTNSYAIFLSSSTRMSWSLV
jgi:hypothetical protein